MASIAFLGRIFMKKDSVANAGEVPSAPGSGCLQQRLLSEYWRARTARGCHLLAIVQAAFTGRSNPPRPVIAARLRAHNISVASSKRAGLGHPGHQHGCMLLGGFCCKDGAWPAFCPSHTSRASAHPQGCRFLQVSRQHRGFCMRFCKHLTQHCYDSRHLWGSAPIHGS